MCTSELANSEEEVKWVKLGSIGDSVAAGFAREVLASYEIPAVILSKSGFFGQVGLTFNRFYKPGSSMFEVSVPESFIDEATDVLNMTLGSQWQREDN